MARPTALLPLAAAPLVLSLLAQPVLGSATALSPVIATSSALLEFGCVEVGDCRALHIEIWNATYDPASTLNITEIQASGPGYELLGPEPPVVIPGNGSTVGWNVQLCPGDEGHVAGTLRITAPGAVNAPLEVPLRGIGDSGAAPIADAGGPYQGGPHTPIQFDGSGSSSHIMRYVWEFGDGRTDGGVIVTHSYASLRAYAVTLTVTDRCGRSAGSNTEVTVGDNSPPVCAAGPNGFAQRGTEVVFDASGSFDPDGTIIRYEWTFGDGHASSSTGPVAYHVYQGASLFTVTLTVEDDYHSRRSCARRIDVFLPPICNTGGPYAGDMGEPITFDGSASYDPQQATLTHYLWEFGDGETGTGAIVAHTYGPNGSYVATLTLESDLGGVSMCSTDVSVTGDNALPVCDAGETGVVELGTEMVFDGSGSVDPDGAIVEYAWQFGDGATGSGVRPSHLYAAHGRYAVTLCVFDDIGSRTCCGDTLIVNIAPHCELPQSIWLSIGEPSPFYCRACRDPDGEVVAWLWTFGDGGTAEGEIVQHAYEEGAYTLTLELTDDVGGTSSCQTEVVVTPEPAVLLIEFAASAGPDRVVLQWRSGAESSNQGYHVLRAPRASDMPRRITGAMIPGGGDTAGAYHYTDRAVEAGAHYAYWLEAIDRGGGSERHGPVEVDVPHAPTVVDLPFELEPAVPNPVNPRTAFSFSIPESGPVRLRLFDANGRPVRELVRGRLDAGRHVARWDGRDRSGHEVASGLYFMRLESGARVATRKLILLR
ncbi:MAG: PKD domain-containing protein [Candidatus Eiseniibacteriota bacterium]|jgi:PKD repeat protein